MLTRVHATWSSSGWLRATRARLEMAEWREWSCYDVKRGDSFLRFTPTSGGVLSWGSGDWTTYSKPRLRFIINCISLWTSSLEVWAPPSSLCYCLEMKLFLWVPDPPLITRSWPVSLRSLPDSGENYKLKTETNCHFLVNQTTLME